MWFIRVSNRLSATKVFSFTTRRLLSSEVRVRFAPSPTGFIHLGGLRTAFYNFLFAKQNNGSFILRIEDTDRERVVSGSLENLEQMLLWTGLIPDEGPTKGGPYGPYIQSQRTDLYKKHIEHLLGSGHGYRCFCSDERLQQLRKDNHKYDNRCRHLSQSEVDEKLLSGQSFAIRLKLKEGPIEFDDLVFGPVSYDLSTIEADPIVFKSNGFPTYHFANVVDDHYMKITHVLRGLEWQVSTPKHLMLYEAFGWAPPLFGHLPLMLNKDGSKLSKRQNHIRIDYFRDEGYYPQTLVNYLSTIGGGFGFRNDDSFESLEQMIETFDVKKLKVNNNKIDLERLQSYNRFVIYWFLENGFENKLIEELKVLLISRFGTSEGLNLDDKYLKFLLSWSKERIFVLKDLLKDEFMFLWRVPDLNWSPKEVGNIEEMESVLKSMINLIENCDQSLEFSTKNMSQLIKKDFDDNFSKSMKFNKYMKILRLSLTNYKSGPPVGETLELLGRQKSIDYLKNAINYLKSNEIIPNKSQIN